MSEHRVTQLHAGPYDPVSGPDPDDATLRADPAAINRKAQTRRNSRPSGQTDTGTPDTALPVVPLSTKQRRSAGDGGTAPASAAAVPAPRIASRRLRVDVWGKEGHIMT
jgi:hypothetical protein